MSTKNMIIEIARVLFVTIGFDTASFHMMGVEYKHKFPPEGDF